MASSTYRLLLGKITRSAENDDDGVLLQLHWTGWMDMSACGQVLVTGTGKGGSRKETGPKQGSDNAIVRS